MNNIFKEVLIVSKMIGESTVFALTSLKTDKFRTFLSLLGVAIGIFSIVAVFCAVDSLQANITEGLSSFGSDVVYIQQDPWAPEMDENGNPLPYKWWEYRKRPEVDEDDYAFLHKRSKTSKDVVYTSMFGGMLKNGRNSYNNGYIVATTPGIEEVANVEISSGRSISPTEYDRGINVAVIGDEIAQTLFPGEDPVGKTIKVKEKKTVVIGVIKKQGKSMVQVFNMDVAVIIPLNYGKVMYNVAKKGGMIIMAPKEEVSSDEFIGETKSLLRAHRRLKADQKDNFSVNEMTFLVNSMSQLLGVINLVGWVIGGFSLLIGGFGIANIMFVSVKERTNQIGIQKALGAKRYVIMTQFLVEAGVLSIAGGVMGVLIVFIASLFLKNMDGFTFIFSVASAISGLLIALVIGVISGVIPAYVAAKLDPVKAING